MSAFQTTRWSLLLAARSDGLAARAALAELCQRYRQPVLGYVRHLGHSAADAEDLTQAFFMRLLEQRFDSSATPARGRFRSYLLGCLHHFLADLHAAKMTRKRGGEFDHRELSESVQQVVDPAPNPEHVFDRAFALAVIDRAHGRLQQEADAAGKRAQLDALASVLLEPREAGALKLLAARLGVRSNTLAVAVKRWRTRLAELVRAELIETVADPAALDDELRALRAALQST